MRHSGASRTGAQNHVVKEERWRVGARGQADRRGLDAHLRRGCAARFAARATAQRRGCRDAGHRRVRLLPCLRHRRARATEGLTALARVSDDLLLAAQSGDRHALTQLLVALQPDIRRYARRHCHRTSVIEDVVQEALIVVYRRVGTIRSPAALAGWLVTVIARLCMLPALMLMRGVEELARLEESREKRPKAACAAPAHWCANTCLAQRTADERAHELLSWSRHVRERLPGRTLMRGAAAAVLLAWAIVHQTAHPWLSLGAGVAALVALRGCPVCWTVGLVETLSQGRRGRTKPRRHRPSIAQYSPRNAPPLRRQLVDGARGY